MAKVIQSYRSADNLVEWLRRLVDRISDDIYPEEWHEIGATNQPGFENGWLNYNSSTHPTAAFYKHNDRVYLKGLIKSGTLPGVAFTLPTGYRPSYPNSFAAASNGAFGYFFVDSNGEVNIQVGSNTWFSLAGASFRI